MSTSKYSSNLHSLGNKVVVSDHQNPVPEADVVVKIGGSACTRKAPKVMVTEALSMSKRGLHNTKWVVHPKMIQNVALGVPNLDCVEITFSKILRWVLQA